MSKIKKENAKFVIRLPHLLVKAFTVHKIITAGVLATLLALCGCAGITGGATQALPPPQPLGNFTDSRDGQNYRTVRIGNLTWMAENLNFITNDSWCLNNRGSNCEVFGRLYTWEAAVSACPAGWRLPDTADVDRLIRVAGGGRMAGRNLKSRTGWNNRGNGIDHFGFSALPGEYRHSSRTLDFVDRTSANILAGALSVTACRSGCFGIWWTTTERAGRDNHVHTWHMTDSDSSVVISRNAPKNFGYSVRCVQD
jgi:uncharacterized protein (TIGR02145 family)